MLCLCLPCGACGGVKKMTGRSNIVGELGSNRERRRTSNVGEKGGGKERTRSTHRFSFCIIVRNRGVRVEGRPSIIGEWGSKGYKDEG